MRRTHLAEPVGPVLSAMLADVVGDDFIAFFVVTYRQKVDKQETTTMAMIIFGDDKDTAYDGDGNVMMAMMMMMTTITTTMTMTIAIMMIMTATATMQRSTTMMAMMLLMMMTKMMTIMTVMVMRLMTMKTANT